MITLNALLAFAMWAGAASLTLWVFFLAVMAIKAANDAGRVPKLVKPFAYILVGVGLVIDFVVNVFVATISFLELPKEFTVTSRVSRHEHNGEGWRKTLATWVCKNLLDPFEVGGHC